MKTSYLTRSLGASLALAALLIAGGCGDGADDEQEPAVHDAAEEHSDEGAVRLSPEELQEFEVEMATADAGRLKVEVSLPGEVRVNADLLAHVVPRVGGVVREVKKNLGDKVRTGEVMAVIESRELADAKAAFLAARERVALADASFDRELRLWKQQVSSEQEYLEAKRDLAETRIELSSSEQKLHALGFSEDELASLPQHPDRSFTRFEIVAPFAGTIIEKHITLGEAVETNAKIFTVADLRTVWIDLSVYQKDLPFVREGQDVAISAGGSGPDGIGVISYVGPIVGEETRTALARVVLENPDGRWRPGLFVTASITVENIQVDLAVPKSAVLIMDGETVVFVDGEEGLEPHRVTVGRSDGTLVEILSGLEQGRTYVSSGGFTLKAELEKESIGGGHGH
ncbi:MAG: efflux RND transporter periplasmic adaptor subunit [Thermoanaerobaculales bacterium]